MACGRLCKRAARALLPRTPLEGRRHRRGGVLSAYGVTEEDVTFSYGMPGHAWVTFDSVVAASQAIDDKHMQTFSFSTRYVELLWSSSHARDAARAAPLTTNVLRCSGLPFGASAAEIAEFFGVAERNVDFRGSNRTHQAWVEFPDVDAAKRALEEKHLATFGSRYVALVPWSEFDERRLATARAEAPGTTEPALRSSAETATLSSPASPSSPLAAMGDIRKLPDGWQAVHSPEHDREYFWHQVTGATTWEMPVE